MQFFKKHMKQLGTIVTLLALFFVVWKMVTMDVDYGAFATPRAMVILVLSILLQALIFCYMTFPWLHLVRILSGKKISGKQALPVYTKANLMKYIPGNVFQYVARNKLASEANISHVDVALATVLDIGMSMLAPFLISLLLMRRQIFTVLAAYQKTFLLVLMIGIAAVCLFLVLVRWKFRDKLHAYFEKYRRLLQKKTLGQLALAFLLPAAKRSVCGLVCLAIAGRGERSSRKNSAVFRGISVLLDCGLYYARLSGGNRHSGSRDDADLRHVFGYAVHCPVCGHDAASIHLCGCCRLWNRGRLSANPAEKGKVNENVSNFHCGR